MQVLAISASHSLQEMELIQRHHQLRARVFADRLGWEVSVVGGYESDVFDQHGPTYILAISASGEVAGCARLLPATGPTMVTDVFPSLLPGGQLHSHSMMVESSRFCVDTKLAEGRGAGSFHEATLSMFASIIEWSVENGFTEIVTVTDLRFERILARVGWPLQRIGEPRKIGVTMAVAGILPANAEVFSRLRPAGYSSRISTRVSQAAGRRQ
jgi:acyl homoserine lactone synthase